MKSSLALKVKATGLLASKVNLRRKIEKGALTNVWELAFTLPGLGVISLDDGFNVEVCDTAIPTAERTWVEMPVGDLKKALLAGQYIKKKLSAP
jgi:hypothetical protein